MSTITSRVWLITGANSGLGLALSLYALSKGDKVIAAARDISKIPSSLKDAAPIRIDLNASDADIIKAGHNAWKIYGHIDILCNNAGSGHNAVVEEISGEAMRAQFQTNVFGSIMLIQSLLPSFRAQKSGQILNVSSVAAFDSMGGLGSYCASKAAFEGFTEALADEVRPFGIEVLILQPGFFPTSWFDSTAKTNPANAPEHYREWYEVSNTIENFHVRDRQAGDIQKCVTRIWEVVHKTGFASDIQFDGSKSSMRVYLGLDCVQRTKEKIGWLTENVNKTEKIWRSVEMDDKQLDEWIASKH